MPTAERGRCSGCGKPKQLREDGMIPGHTVSWQVSRRAIHTVGKGSGGAKCSGSGKPPKDQG